MNTVTRTLVLLVLAAILLQISACTHYYVPPTTGLPSRTNWLEGGGG